MVCTYRRKTIPVDKEQPKKTVLAVRKDKIKVQTAAKQFGVPRTTLIDWLKKNNNEIANLDDVVIRYHRGLSVSNVNNF